MKARYCPYLSEFSLVKHAFFEANPNVFSSHKDQAMKAMAGASLPLLTLKQVHGRQVIHISEPCDEAKEGDGFVTNLKGIALGIRTADCGPVLFYDPKAGVIGACHAGWRGAKEGILQESLNAMEKIGAKRSRIFATLGPTIQQRNYEVGPEFPELMGGSYDTYFYPSERPGHHYFNLPHYICQHLRNEGLVHVHNVEVNTYTGNFSSRRRFLAEEKKEVHSDNLSAIAIL
ncbi:MAG: polyphenol oxidase family protein [Alphaproteobacteria bacterium]|nr:polyphenol oxidase family protein [Alphaproteobacteria bacterium]